MGSWFANESKIKRASNRETSADILRENGFAFESKNGGAHLIVSGATIIADFWPGTGKFSVRGTGKYSRGVFSLLKILKKDVAQ